MKKKETKLNIETILKMNPHIDKKSFEEIRKSVRNHKPIGGKGAKYNLLSPFESRIFLLSR